MLATRCIDGTHAPHRHTPASPFPALQRAVLHIQHEGTYVRTYARTCKPAVRYVTHRSSAGFAVRTCMAAPCWLACLSLLPPLAICTCYARVVPCRALPYTVVLACGCRVTPAARLPHTAPNERPQSYAFVVRAISTVYNYDYLWDHIFYMDGTMEVKVMAFGYVLARSFTSTSTYTYTWSCVCKHTVSRHKLMVGGQGDGLRVRTTQRTFVHPTVHVCGARRLP